VKLMSGMFVTMMAFEIALPATGLEITESAEIGNWCQSK
jgi:hypothetical protein